MTSLTTRGRQVRTRLYDPAMVAQLAIAVLAVGALLFAESTLSMPAKVGLTVTNPTEYDVDVVVRAPGAAEATMFGRVERGGSRTQPHLIDPGESWEIVFRHDGVVLAELRLTDAELDELGHRIEVPPEVVVEAQDAELVPTPR